MQDNIRFRVLANISRTNVLQEKVEKLYTLTKIMLVHILQLKKAGVTNLNITVPQIKLFSSAVQTIHHLEQKWHGYRYQGKRLILL